ncbi:MAG: hypothetical protein NWE83_03675 [Candidatus Bathyarchaeota archaeon]|nr:hypothetical protein [Candidatus Bathyarchaeota archaeon]
MPRFLMLYKVNTAMQPTDPQAALKQTETNMAAADDLVKAGIFTEMGSFNPGEGYAIVELPSREEAYKLAQRFWPGIISDTREIISWKKTKEITLSILKEQATT